MTDASGRSKEEQIRWLMRRLLATLARVHRFDGDSVRPRLDLGSSDLRDQAMNTALLRSLGNVRSLLKLAAPPEDPTVHFQAIGMIARAVLELSIDARLIELREDAGNRLHTYGEYQKLRSANAIVAHNKRRKAHPRGAKAQRGFRSKHSARIKAEAEQTWPKKEGSKKWFLPAHWSCDSLEQAARDAGGITEDLYGAEYRQLNWMVHSGVVGFLDVQQEAFPAMCTSFIQTTLRSYGECLGAGIRYFGFERSDPSIIERLEAARDPAVD